MAHPDQGNIKFFPTQFLINSQVSKEILKDHFATLLRKSCELRAHICFQVQDSSVGIPLVWQVWESSPKAFSPNGSAVKDTNWPVVNHNVIKTCTYLRADMELLTHQV